jgi:adenine-specific DNA methylase
LSEILEFDDDGVDEDRQNDIDFSRMNASRENNDHTMGGSEKLQASLTDLITDYDNIFSYSVKGRSMDVPPRNLKSMKRAGKAVATEWRHSRMLLNREASHSQDAYRRATRERGNKTIQGNSVVIGTLGAET